MDKREQGFSLVEMIASMAIVSIVGAAVLSLCAYCLNQYTRSSNEINLQYESQLCMNRISNQILAATDGISTAPDGICLYGSSDAGTGSAVSLYLSEDDSCRLMYQEYEQELNGAWTAVGEPECYASYVESFNVTVYDSLDGPIGAAADTAPSTAAVSLQKPVKAEIDVAFRVGEREYHTTNVVALRNDIAVYTD